MKNIRYKMHKMFGVAIIILLSSCESFLDLKPINTPVGETYWQTESDANAAVLGSYFKLRECLEFGGGLRYFTYGDFPTQIFDNTSSEWGTHEFVGNYQYSGNGGISDWSSFYKVILSANLGIKKIAEMPLSAFGNDSGKRDAYLGEAYFIRAYTYFYMTRIWGSVPLILDPIEDAKDALYDVPMASEEELLAQCINDLKQADGYLTWESTGGKKAIRANRASVNAVLAHVYMWRTRPNLKVVDKKNFDNAITCINQIETYSGASLVPKENIATIWRGESVESLFEISFKISNKEGYSKNSGFADRFLGYPYNTDRKLRPIFRFTNNFISLYKEKNKDVRVSLLYENFNDIANCFTTKYNQIQYTNADKTNWETEGTVVLFRLADMYLLKAEALVKKDNPDMVGARNYLDKVRIRAGLDGYAGVDAGLYEEVIDERARELFLEGHRLYDWVRTGFYAAKSNGNYSQDRYDREGYLHPVNFKLIINNRFVRQTPYWSDKMFL